jgi:hypothetical protein
LVRHLADGTSKRCVRTVVLLVAIGWTAVAAQISTTRSADRTTGNLVRAVRRLEAKLGLHHAGSFAEASSKAAVDYRCYYTGKLQLPNDYQGLRLKSGTPQGCRLNARKYDIFFYPLQAMASPKTPVTASLAHAPPERVLMVVPHEDFHQDPAIAGLPAPVSEAAATLVGFLMARDVAREQFGTASEIYRQLSIEPQLFLKKSRLTNDFYNRVKQLYSAYRAKEISKARALAAKARLFGAVERQCESNEPRPRTFNRCLATNNNAGLAFDHTYTFYYPLMYSVAQANAEKLRDTIAALREAMMGRPAAQAIENLRQAARFGASHRTATGTRATRRVTKGPAPSRRDHSEHGHGDIAPEAAPGWD